MAGSSAPFTMDMANQIASTKGFEGLVDAARVNNNNMQATADEALTANQGEMSHSFQLWAADVIHTALSNNQVLDEICHALHFGIGATGNTDSDGASAFQGLHTSGSHFG